ncbi:MAG: SAM-dependent methyltransferase [Pyrinomonadaceae bacterium]|nr:SAM-dependent methyltransferase [Pyrinomonadaceae bacterium]
MKENEPSATADVVARNIVLISNTPALACLVPQDARLLSGWLVADSSGKGHSFVRRSGKRWFQMVRRIQEHLTIPGLALHQALRKRYIERAVRLSLSEGFEQVVVLGGGLDSLAVRLHREFPTANFIELDHPATQSVKLGSLTRRRLVGRNLSFLPVDFARQSLEERIKSCDAYQAERKTIFLAEGVLMYLAASEVESIFDFVRRQPCAQKRFVFTFMELDAKGRAGFRRSTRLVRLWLRMKGEPFKWGMRAGETENFLARRGFVLKDMATSRSFKEIYLREHGIEDELLAEGENVCVSDAI